VTCDLCTFFSVLSLIMSVLITPLHVISVIITDVCFLYPFQTQKGSKQHTWPDNKFRDLIAVKLLHTFSLKTTVVSFKVLPSGSYTPMPAPGPPIKTILELVLWKGLQSCRCVTADVISVIKMHSFHKFLYDMIYIYLTAVGLTPGGSSTSHIYKQTVRIIQR
jgi:hypothetical protein